MTARKFPGENNGRLASAGSYQVDVTSGNLHLVVTDYAQADIGEDFVFRRCYDSLRIRRGQPLGDRWLLNTAGIIERDGRKLRAFVDTFHREKFRQSGGRWENENGSTLGCRLIEHISGFIMEDIKRSRVYEYDKEGRLLRLTRFGAQSLEFAYAGKHLAKIVLASGREIDFSFAEGRLRTLTDGLGRINLYEYEEGLLTGVTYPNNGRLTYEYTPEGLLLAARSRTGKQFLACSYDRYGRIIRLQPESGAPFCYTYREQERQAVVSRQGEPDRVYAWNRLKQIESIRQEDGSCQSFEYDARGNCISVRSQEGTIRRKYDGADMLIEEQLPNGRVTSYRRDERGRVVEQQDNTGGIIRRTWSAGGLCLTRKKRLAERQWQQDAWAYDARGRLVRRSYGDAETVFLYEEGAPLPARMETADGAKFTFRYDRANRLLAISCEAGERIFGWTPMDFLASDTDALGRRIAYRYDLQGRLVTVTLPGEAGEETWRILRNGDGTRKGAADLEGRRISLGQPVINGADAAYKEKGRQPGAIRPMRFYDIGGQLFEERLFYDEPSGAADWDEEDLGLSGWIDESGAEPSGTALSREAAAECYGVHGWKYDDRLRCTEERFWLDAQDEVTASGRVRTIRYLYDAAGRRIVANDNRGASVSFRYTPLGQVAEIRWRINEERDYALRCRYDGAGLPVSCERQLDYRTKGALWEEVPFPVMGKLAGAGCVPHLVLPEAAGEGAAAAEVLHANRAGWPLLVRDAAGHEHAFAYDALGGVRGYMGAGRRIAYRTDIWGRVTEARIREHGSEAEEVWYFACDYAGNVTEIRSPAGEVTRCTYDERNRLAALSGQDWLNLAGQALSARQQQQQVRRLAGQAVLVENCAPLSLAEFVLGTQPVYRDSTGYIRGF